jgi:type I restriction enzyme M protein
VDCIVAVGNNFFYTRSLPCHVWFLDKGKRPENKNRILMIDARNTFRVVTNTINDYSPGQLRNFMAIMGAYRGDASAIADANHQHQQSSVEMAQAITAEINQLRELCREILAAHGDVTLDFSTVLDALAKVMGIADDLDYPACFDLVQLFENPVEQLSAQMAAYQSQLEADKKAWASLAKKDKTSAANKAKKKQLDAHNKLLRALTAAIGTHEKTLKADLANYKQQVNDWHTLREHFPDNQYRDIEGLCKIVNREEVAENDYSLTPGRYMGYSIQIDEDFDYQGRMKEIKSELMKLSRKSSELMEIIQGTEV